MECRLDERAGASGEGLPLREEAEVCENLRTASVAEPAGTMTICGEASWPWHPWSPQPHSSSEAAEDPPSWSGNSPGKPRHGESERTLARLLRRLLERLLDLFSKVSLSMAASEAMPLR